MGMDKLMFTIVVVIAIATILLFSSSNNSGIVNNNNNNTALAFFEPVVPDNGGLQQQQQQPQQQFNSNPAISSSQQQNVFFNHQPIDLPIQGVNDTQHCAADRNHRPNSHEYLTWFNCGRTNSTDGTKEFTLIAEENQQIPISEQGHIADAWTFNNTVPGPTMRVREGDHVRITLINSPFSSHPHSIHMHSVHTSSMDGVEGKGGGVAPGQSFTYDFVAGPYGVYPYHCHVSPLQDHINRGLYGVLIIDPKEPRPAATEMVMLMNGYDLDYQDEGQITIRPPGQTEEEFDQPERDNEIYTVNGKAFDYTNSPIRLHIAQPYRIYVVNMLEFDLVNSFHLHGNMYKYNIAGTSKKSEYITDIVTMTQGDRGIVEFTYPYMGRYMFHAHQAEFTDKGWMAFFDVIR